MRPDTVSIPVGESAVSGVLHRASEVGVIIAHGAGADMNTPLVVSVAEGLAARGLTTLRFNFLYKERGGRAPDKAPVLESTYLAVIEAMRRYGVKKLFIGGKSMGGRYASIVASKGAVVEGLVFLGYPLHPAGKPEQLRDEHLPKVKAPMLFVQGTRDALCDLALLRPVLKRLGKRATLHVVEGGDHSLDLLKSKKKPREEVHAKVVQVIAKWIDSH